MLIRQLTPFAWMQESLIYLDTQVLLDPFKCTLMPLLLMVIVSHRVHPSTWRQSSSPRVSETLGCSPRTALVVKPTSSDRAVVLLTR